MPKVDSMVKIVIVDDEKHCSDILEMLIEKEYPEHQIVGVFNNPLEALDFIQNNKIDLLFLDVQMPKLTGFRLLDSIVDINFDVIFTTAFDQFAIRAFDYSAFHYLLKPITKKALISTIDSWENRRRQLKTEQWELLNEVRQNKNKEIETTKLALPIGGGYKVIHLNGLVRCQSESNYTSFHFNDGEVLLVSRTLKDVEGLLAGKTFFRTHQSHLINVEFVEKISREEGGSILMSDGKEVPISRQRKGSIQNILDKMLKLD